VHPSRNLFWRAAFLSLGIHALAFALLVETPILPHLHADPGGAVQVRLLSAPVTPPAPPATPPAARQPPPTPVVSPPSPPPPVVTPPPPKPKPRPVVAQKPLPQPPDPPPPPPIVQEVTPALPPQPTAPSAAPAASVPAPVTGSPPPSAAGGDLSTATADLGAAGPGSDTVAELIRHLEAHRRYPAQARRRGIEGTVGLAFRVAPEGDLLVAEVRQPSGSRLLDRAALRTLERAFPLPPHLARRLAGEELTIDLSFRLVDR